MLIALTTSRTPRRQQLCAELMSRLKHDQEGLTRMGWYTICPRLFDNMWINFASTQARQHSSMKAGSHDWWI